MTVKINLLKKYDAQPDTDQTCVRRIPEVLFLIASNAIPQYGQRYGRHYSNHITSAMINFASSRQMRKKTTQTTEKQNN